MIMEYTHTHTHTHRHTHTDTHTQTHTHTHRHTHTHTHTQKHTHTTFSEPPVPTIVELVLMHGKWQHILSPGIKDLICCDESKSFSLRHDV